MLSGIYTLTNIASGDDEDEEEGEEGEEKMPTCGDYIMHFLTLVWKVIFAVIPPAGASDFKLLLSDSFGDLGLFLDNCTSKIDGKLCLESSLRDPKL